MKPRPAEIAYVWASRATSIAIAMVAPGVLGLGIDHYFATTPWFSIAGFTFGFPYGLWRLIKLASQPVRPTDSPNKQTVEPKQE